MFKPRGQNNRGFTLIELLIVIMLLGILAAGVITVINPNKQRLRAQDGVLKGTISKIGAAIDAYYAVYEDVPSVGSEFTSEVESSTNMRTANWRDAYFDMEGVNSGRTWFYYPDPDTGRPNGINYVRDRYGIAGCVAAPVHEGDNRDFFVWMPREEVRKCRNQINSSHPLYACLGYAGYGGTRYGRCEAL